MQAVAIQTIRRAGASPCVATRALRRKSSRRKAPNFFESSAPLPKVLLPKGPNIKGSAIKTPEVASRDNKGPDTKSLDVESLDIKSPETKSVELSNAETSSLGANHSKVKSSACKRPESEELDGRIANKRCKVRERHDQQKPPPTNRAEIVQDVQAILRFNFTNEEVLLEALQPAGQLGRENLVCVGNQRLAILGDVVMRLVLMEKWYHGGSHMRQSTVVFEKFASNVNLVRTFEVLKLCQYVNRVESGIATRVPWQTPSAKVKADTVEAILGAVHIEGGHAAVKEVMKTMGLMPP